MSSTSSARSYLITDGAAGYVGVTTRVTAEAYVRLARIAAELVERAEVDGEHARVPAYLVRRVEREVRGRPQPQDFFTMSVD